ncbi:MAG: dihydrofolate reductase [Lacunisphaera sp.]
MPKPISLIVACTENRVIGSGRLLPFQIPEDKAWFAAKTTGSVVILGRVSFEVWSAARTEGRQPVVVTRESSLASAGVRVAPTVTEALAIAQTLPGEIMVCGGARIYEETLPIAQRLFLTLVHAELPGDVKFPEWRHYPWRETWKRESQDANFRYTFSILEK